MSEIYTERYSNHNIKKIMYYNDKDELHKEDGPAMLEYYLNGNFKCIAYSINDNFHRDKKPAVINYNENGKIIREQYFTNDKLNRLDGPAYIQYDKYNGNIISKLYYIEGKEYNELQFLIKTASEK